MKTPLTLALIVLSSAAFAQQDQLDLGQALSCCLDRECRKLNTFVWRRAPYGVDVMLYKGKWCPVRVSYLPPTPIFDGEPMDFCDQLECVPTELLRTK
jgi:hypothetical protein